MKLSRPFPSRRLSTTVLRMGLFTGSARVETGHFFML
uniref:Uncharacterized protein n=1 Tax=Anguilla anguilla TaxID=7936 RepID=A0A0E9QAN7_ANGAN